MQKYIETKKNNILKNLIGVLLIIPIYIPIIMLINVESEITIVLMYLPIVCGIIESYKDYREKCNKSIITLILMFSCTSLYYFYITYFTQQDGWDGLGSFFLFLFNMFILRIVLLLYYKKIAGFKKTLILFVTYVFFIIFCILFDHI